MCGSLSADTVRASCEKRRRISGSASKPSGRSFKATLRLNRVSSARKTSPIPPCPSLRRIRKCESASGASSGRSEVVAGASLSGLAVKAEQASEETPAVLVVAQQERFELAAVEENALAAGALRGVDPLDRLDVEVAAALRTLPPVQQTALLGLLGLLRASRLTPFRVGFPDQLLFVLEEPAVLALPADRLGVPLHSGELVRCLHRAPQVKMGSQPRETKSERVNTIRIASQKSPPATTICVSRELYLT